MVPLVLVGGRSRRRMMHCVAGMRIGLCRGRSRDRHRVPGVRIGGSGGSGGGHGVAGTRINRRRLRHGVPGVAGVRINRCRLRHGMPGVAMRCVIAPRPGADDAVLFAPGLVGRGRFGGERLVGGA